MFTMLITEGFKMYGIKAYKITEELFNYIQVGYYANNVLCRRFKDKPNEHYFIGTLDEYKEMLKLSEFI